MGILKKISKCWFKLDDKIRFLFIGGVNFVFSYLLFILFIFLLGKELYQVCVLLQWSISSVFSFCNQKYFVFCTKGNFWQEYIKCCTTWIAGCILNEILLKILLHYFTNIYIIQIFSIGLVSVFTYVLFKYFAFKKSLKN